MKNLVILGAGTGGTLLANAVERRLGRDWQVTVVDPAPKHLYQPGLLFLPFGAHDETLLEHPRATTLRRRISWRKTDVRELLPDQRKVRLGDGDDLSYDLLVIATGSEVRPDLTEGLLEKGWGDTAHTFYTLSGALALREALGRFERGRLVLSVAEMPIKCPVAPLEFLFLADEYFTRRGLREQVDLVYATPLDGAFTKPLASKRLGYLLENKHIVVEKEFALARVDGERRLLVSYDEREVPYDLLVSIPVHSGARWIEPSGIGNELQFIPTDPNTLQAKGLPNVFVLGDATDLPSSKAGSVAHFQGELLADNLLRVMSGKSPEPTFDGHANCFVETGFGRAMLIDFNYETEPLPGKYPLAGIGPFSLLRETKINHQGKLAFRWLYWNALLPARALPVPARMSMSGKDISKTQGDAHA
jgi:sulfide:quinone oxidoreductase